MFKKFLLVTSALVAVHAGDNPFGVALAEHGKLVAGQGKLGQSLVAASELYDTIKEDNTNLTRTVTFLNGKITELESDLSAQKAKASKSAQLQLELGTAQAGLATAQNERDRLSAEIKETSSNLEAANASVAALQDELKTAKSTSSSTVADLQTQLAEAKQQADERQKTLADMQSQHDALSTQYQQACSDLETTNASVVVLEGRLEAAVAERSSTVATLQTQLADAEKQAKDTQQTLADMQSQHNTSIATLQALREQFTQESSALEAAKDNVAVLQGELQAAEAERSAEKTALEEQLKAAKEETQAKQLELATKQDQLRTINKELRSITEDFNTLESTHKVQATELVTAKTYIIEVEGNKVGLRQQLSEAQTTIIQLEAQLAEKSAAAQAPSHSGLDGIIAEIRANASDRENEAHAEYLLRMLPETRQEIASNGGYYERLGRIFANALHIGE